MWKRSGNARVILRAFSIAIPCLSMAVLSLAPTLAQSSTDRRFSKERGAWSAEAVSLFNTELRALDRNPGRRLKFDSPDHKKAVEVVDQDVFIWIGGKRFETSFAYKNCAELGWAPDSSRFFLTWTENGELGPWHVEVYDVSEDGLHEVKDIDKRPRSDFDESIRQAPIPKDMQTGKMRIFWDNDEYCLPNVVAAQWLEGSSQLLVSALIPNVGDCRYSSEFNVYRIEVPSGKIIQRYTAREAYHEFSHRNLPLIAK